MQTKYTLHGMAAWHFTEENDIDLASVELVPDP
ncbi:MAG: hypothetical protein UX87_C0049G0005 [Candidatus Amesbacteria bacterium GW2011_GWA1_47_16]|uniref:Uncharacterized protein n=1 Tax=Candidatus Amesbacteria bacterium GW2011_GWA1_47_16 TaxID=1618353 RepID=A0A0G1RYL8_9BACT|nr:MAG: hypothetical protein UX87_C0049G0005 [Candidatus Amesbacteria bacterium GW2011_GWA1_47_16]